MNEVWMLVYLNAVVLAHGVFPSEGHARAYIERNDPDRAHFYVPFKVPVNHKLDVTVPVSAPNRVYRVQK